MSNRMSVKLLALLSVLFLVLNARAEQRVGRLSSLIGNVQIKGASGLRNAVVTSPIYDGESVITGNDDAASLLLESRAVVKMDSNTELKIVDTGGSTQLAPGGALMQQDAPGTMLQLGQGTVVVYLAKRAANEGTVSLSDTIARIDTTGTVFAATYSPQTKDGLYSCQENSIKLRPAGGGAVTVVSANQLAKVREGRLLGVQKLDLQEFRNRTPALQKLSQQSASRDASVAQQRTDAVSLRQTFATEFKKQGNTEKKSKQLAELLLGRCTDLDVLASKGANAAGIDGTIAVNDGIVNVGLFDGAPDGDRISLNARSCTDANLKTIADTAISKTLNAFTVKIETPNILEINVKSLATGTVPGNGIGINISAEPNKRGIIRSPLAGGKTEGTLRFLITDK